MEEIWKYIENCKGYYMVSNRCRVKSISRTILRNGKPYKVKESILTPWDKDGYKCVCLCVDKVKKIRLHRLIAEAFIPNPENKPYVNHINGIKSDNSVENLEWCTQSENLVHAYKIGAKKPSQKGKNAPNAKMVLAIKDVVIIEYKSLRDCKNSINVDTQTVVRHISNGQELKGYNLYYL